jgi:hypothetical protein
MQELETGKSPSQSVEEAVNAESRAKEVEDRRRKAEEEQKIVQQQVDNLRKQILELERIQRVDQNLNHYGLTLDNFDAYLDLRGQGFGPKSSKIVGQMLAGATNETPEQVGKKLVEMFSKYANLGAIEAKVQEKNSELVKVQQE